MKQNILLTGASGNVGSAILKHFSPNAYMQMLLASRKTSGLQANERYFDLEKIESFAASLPGIDVLFLLRPPHLAEVPKYFTPLTEACKNFGVKHIIFLSVQGAEKVSFIPHAKIEKLIVESGIAYTFIRPSYFMQNLTTTLKDDIIQQNRIFLPADKTPFLWIDVDDIGLAIAKVLQDPDTHINKAYTITGSELIDFQTAAKMLSDALGRKLDFISPNLLRFFIQKRKENTPIGYILVMILLHYLPRFQPLPEVSKDFQKLTGKQPNTLNQFIKTHKNELL